MAQDKTTDGSPFARGAGPIVLAHRGAPREACENTLRSFALALEAGADVLELDLRRTRDGRLVVLHDANMRRIAGVDVQAATLTLAELQRLPLRAPAPATGRAGCATNVGRVPSLRQFLAAFPAASCNVDLKESDPFWARVLLDELRAARAAGDARGHFVLTSFADRQLEALRRGVSGARGEATLGVGRVGCLSLLASAYTGLPPPRSLRGRVVQVPVSHHVFGRAVRVVTDRFIDRVHAAGCALHVWCDETQMVDDPAEARALFARGVDGVFTNDVRGMVAALRGRTCRDTAQRAGPSSAPPTA